MKLFCFDLFDFSKCLCYSICVGIKYVLLVILSSVILSQNIHFKRVCFDYDTPFYHFNVSNRYDAR